MGDEESVVTARERRTVGRGRMERGAFVDAISLGGGDSGSVFVWWCWRMVSEWLRAAPAWRVVVDECRDREVEVGDDDGGEDPDEAMRLNCGCRRGRYFRHEADIVVGVANVLPRCERAGTRATILC